MKKMLLLVMLSASVMLAGCSGDKGKELFDTAQFEEKQHNVEHAVQLYGEIVEKYPRSEYAGKAAERLTALRKK
jgi:outer membrane biogenesis lipoprotein LolB